MPRITISYRRDDSGVITGRIFDRLVGHYGRNAVFRDIDNIPLGVDFRKHIEHVFDSSDIVLAIVGPHWVGPSLAENRLSNEADPVRIEIEGALRKGATLIPVLVLGARMPTAGELPETVKDFAYRNAVQLDAGQDFDLHMARLIRGIDGVLGLPERAAPADEADAVSPATRPTQRRLKRRPLLAAGIVSVVIGAGSAIGLYVQWERDRATTPSESPSIAPNPPAMQSPVTPAAPGTSPALEKRATEDRAAAVQPPAPPNADAELLFWQSVMNSGAAADYEAYLRQYPHGRFADLANNRLAAARRSPQQALANSPYPDQAEGNRPHRPAVTRAQCAAAPGDASVRQYCASSVLPARIGDRSGHSNYEVTNLFDDNLTTAWVKARDQAGNGWILVDFDGERQVTALTVANGYQKNATTFQTNFRVSRLRLLSSRGETTAVALVDGGGTQRAVLPQPLRGEWVQIFIDELFPSVPEADVALSELRVITERVP
jgi:hypothetical protein